MSDSQMVNLPPLREEVVQAHVRDLEDRTAYEHLLSHLQMISAAFRAAHPLQQPALNGIFRQSGQPVAVSLEMASFRAAGVQGAQAAEGMRGKLLRYEQAMQAQEKENGPDGTAA
jgi:hypothetical protein